MVKKHLQLGKDKITPEKNPSQKNIKKSMFFQKNILHFGKKVKKPFNISVYLTYTTSFIRIGKV